jgi:hypothetical protein
MLQVAIPGRPTQERGAEHPPAAPSGPAASPQEAPASASIVHRPVCAVQYRPTLQMDEERSSHSAPTSPWTVATQVYVVSVTVSVMGVIRQIASLAQPAGPQAWPTAENGAQVPQVNGLTCPPGLNSGGSSHRPPWH